MKEKPIIMSAESVRGILAGRKTQTRRVIKPANPFKAARAGGYRQGDGLWIDGYKPGDEPNGHIKDYSVSSCWIQMPIYIRKYAPYKPGDILWVRETWMLETEQGIPTGGYIYLATDRPEPDEDGPLKWTPSIYMIRAAARLFLRVTSVRVERLNDISPEDCIAEGMTTAISHRILNNVHAEFKCSGQDAIATYAALWDELNAKRDAGAYAWDKNPWVWAYTFERIPQYLKDAGQRADQNTIQYATP